jgi:hypothetical protein
VTPCNRVYAIVDTNLDHQMDDHHQRSQRTLAVHFPLQVLGQQLRAMGPARIVQGKLVWVGCMVSGADPFWARQMVLDRVHRRGIQL